MQKTSVLGSFLLIFVVFGETPLFSQDSLHKKFSKEISFKTENDAYLLSLKDAYYTNGFFINYGWADSKRDGKKIHGLEFGQTIFTPLLRTTQSPKDIDRAYSGYLYLKYSQTHFLPKEKLFIWNGSLGLVGPSSGAEGLQNTYHKWLKFSRFTGWRYQIGNSLGIDAGMVYAQTALESKSIKWVPVMQLNLGTSFTNAKIGAILVLGSFEKNQHSALWNARINESSSKQKRNHEFFAYWYPQMIVQGYNATLQGGLLSKSDSAVTQSPSTFMYQQTIGICYAQGRWTARLEGVYQSKETPSQIKAQRYGVIQLSYRMY
jgi:lipid A 3-O-deacylase